MQSEILIFVIGLICTMTIGVIGYLLKALIERLEKGNETLNNLDKSIAVLREGQKRNSEKIEHLESDLSHKMDKIDADLSDMKRVMIGLDSDMRILRHNCPNLVSIARERN